MAVTAYFVINIAQIGILLLALLIHSLRIYLLYHIKETRTNQNLILIHLSLIEIFTSTLAVAHGAGVSILKMDEKVAVSLYYFCIGAYLIFYLIMIALTLDRLAMSLLSIKYHTVITRGRMKVALIACWPIGVLCGAVFVKLQSYKIAAMVYIIADGCFLVLMIITYTTVLSKISKRRELLQRNEAQNNDHHQEPTKFYLITGLIISSFTLFAAVPNLCKLFLFDYNSRSFGWEAILLLWCFNNIIDPCIYIFLQKPVRKLLRKKIIIWTKATDSQTMWLKLLYTLGHRATCHRIE